MRPGSAARSAPADEGSLTGACGRLWPRIPITSTHALTNDPYVLSVTSPRDSRASWLDTVVGGDHFEASVDRVERAFEVVVVQCR